MINIMFAGNRKVFDGVLMASISITKYCKDPIKVFILTMDLSEKNLDFCKFTEEQIACLEKVYKDVNRDSLVVVVDVKNLFLLELKDSPNAYGRYTPYALLRLFADKIDIIPDKILYLDADILVNGDISELYNIDLYRYEIAGVRDYYGKFFFNPRYLNSGVLCMNMKEIRRSGMLEKARHLCNRRKVFLPDQTAINKYTRKKLILPSRFNEQKKMREDTLIRHFTMTFKIFPKFKKQNIKPWHIDMVHDVLKTYEFDDVYARFNDIINCKGG